MDSLHGLTKGTELEQAVEALALGEAKGVMMYYALARLAKEQGLNEVAAQLIESANQEAVHSGFYATLNGKYPKDFWAMLKGAQKAETAGETSIKALADQVRAAGFATAADEMEIFAKQEGHHGVVLGQILEKYGPKDVEPAEGKKIYVCPVCGYEYEGYINAEPDDWVCPLCGQPKSAFKEKVADEKPAEKVEKPAAGKKVYVCTICGYEYEGDEVPDDFVCPLCGQPKSVFKLKE